MRKKLNLTALCIILSFTACGATDEAEMTDTAIITDTSAITEIQTDIPEDTSIYSEEITSETDLRDYQRLQAVAEDILFYGNEITYSEVYCEQSDMAKRNFDIINSGIYEEYFIESDKIHDFLEFDNYTYYSEKSENNGCYDFIGKNGEYYECYDSDIRYNKTDNCIKSFLRNIIDNYTYTESCYFTAFNEKYICEKYVSGDNICLLYFCEDDICCAALLDENGTHIIENYHLYESGNMLNEDFMIEKFNQCRQSIHHSEEEHENHFNYSFNFNQNNNFDFDAERIRGENIENPHIVESYREYFDTADEFSIYITAKRGELMQYDYATKSGINYYNKSGLQKADEKAIINENLEFENRYYSRCYYENETLNYTLYDDSDYSDIYIYYIIQNNDRPEFNDVDEFIEAYNVTINNEEYICEVWHAGVTDFNVYCKDGKVIAIDTIFYDEHEYSVIEYLYDYAETENISEPEIYDSYSEEGNFQ